MEKKRYGKRINAHLEVVLKENGGTRTLFFDFPKREEYHDRPENVFYQLINFFRRNFDTIDEWTILRALKKTNSPLTDDVLSYLKDGINKEKFGGKHNG